MQNTHKSWKASRSFPHIFRTHSKITLFQTHTLTHPYAHTQAGRLSSSTDTNFSHTQLEHKYIKFDFWSDYSRARPTKRFHFATCRLDTHRVFVLAAMDIANESPRTTADPGVPDHALFGHILRAEAPDTLRRWAERAVLNLVIGVTTADCIIYRYIYCVFNLTYLALPIWKYRYVDKDKLLLRYIFSDFIKYECIP